MAVLPDGDIIFAHYTDFGPEDDMLVYRLDNRGIIKWAQRLGTGEINNVDSIALGTDGTIAISGKAYYDGSNYGIHLTKLTQEEGAILFSRVYHYADIDDRFTEVIQHPNGGFVIKGRGKFPPST